MIIDRTGLKRVALWAGIVLLLTVGTFYLFKEVDQPGQSIVKSETAKTKQSQAAKPAESDFCAHYRMEREQVRSQELTLLDQVVNEAASESQARSKALQRLLQISTDIESEMKMENLVRCHGARDCVAMVEPDNATLIIASPPMDGEQVAEIKSDLCKMLDREVEEISLIFQEN